MLALINDTGILVAVAALVLLFGASRIPQLARNLGQAGKEFKKAQHDDANELSPTTTVPAPLPPSSGGSGSDQLVTLSREQLDRLLSQAGPPHARPQS